VFHKFVGSESFEVAIVDFTLVDGGIGVMLSRMASHVLGEAEGTTAILALVRFFLRMGQLMLDKVGLPGSLQYEKKV
jgi:hypothetical protein